MGGHGKAKASEIYYIGVDVGSASARACLISDDGEMISSATEGTQTWRPQAQSIVCFRNTSKDALSDVFHRSNRRTTYGEASAKLLMKW